jgi:phosphohistidine phosphatase SixA
MLNTISSLVLLTSIAWTPPREELRRESLMEALKAGGYTIILRHARTDRSIPSKETPGYSPKDRADQRNLTADGVRDAKLIGAVLKKYGIPIGEIVSSPLYRTVETAQMAAGNPTTTTMALRVFPSTDEQTALVVAPVRSRTNRLLVTHHFVIEKHVPGIKPGDIGESEAVVVRPDGKGAIEVIGRVTLADWEILGGVRSEPRTNPAPPAGVSSSTPKDIATAYVAAFNTGSSARMREFIERYLLVNPDRPVEARLVTYEEAFRSHGPLTLEMVHSADAAEAVLEMKSRQGSFRLVVRASDTQPGRAASVVFMTTQAGGHR